MFLWHLDEWPFKSINKMFQQFENHKTVHFFHFETFASLFCLASSYSSWTLSCVSYQSQDFMSLFKPHLASNQKIKKSKNHTHPIHTWLFLSSPVKPFDLSLTNSFTPHLLLFLHQYFINVQWQIYLNAVSGTDTEMDGPIRVVVGWWEAW